LANACEWKAAQPARPTAAALAAGAAAWSTWMGSGWKAASNTILPGTYELAKQGGL
jgi:hypothetical protein